MTKKIGVQIDIIITRRDVQWLNLRARIVEYRGYRGRLTYNLSNKITRNTEEWRFMDKEVREYVITPLPLATFTRKVQIILPNRPPDWQWQRGGPCIHIRYLGEWRGRKERKPSTMQRPRALECLNRKRRASGSSQTNKLYDITRADSKSQVRQWLDFCTADFWSMLAYESDKQKTQT